MNWKNLVEDLNNTLLIVQGRGSLLEAEKKEVESALGIIATFKKIERLPSSWAVLKELQIEGIDYEGFERNIEPHTIKKLDLVKRGGYEQASKIRDREFESLSKWVRETTGSFLFMAVSRPDTLYWIFPDFPDEIRDWYLDVLHLSKAIS